MKKIYSLLLLIGIVVAIQSCEKQSPVEYNNGIIAHQVKIVEKIDELKKAIDNYNVLPPDVAIDEMNIAYDKAVFQIDSGISFIQNVEDFKGDNSLKNGAGKLFITYKEIIEGEYKSIIELYKIPDAMFTTEDSEKLEVLSEESNKKLKTAYEDFIKVQKKFEADNNLKLEE